MGNEKYGQIIELWTDGWLDNQQSNRSMFLQLRYILLFLHQDSSSPGDRVTLVHSLVSDGTAERDGRLQKGDKLISVNGVSVVNHTLDFTVEQLKTVSSVS